MILTTEILDALSKQAAESERLRMNLDLRTSPEDTSQRMLNALEMGTDVPIHRHTDSAETVIMLRGSIRELFYDDLGNVVESVVLRADGEPRALNIPKGVWHTLECLEPGSILFEAKDGAFAPRKECDVMPKKK